MIHSKEYKYISQVGFQKQNQTLERQSHCVKIHAIIFSKRIKKEIKRIIGLSCQL